MATVRLCESVAKIKFIRTVPYVCLREHAVSTYININMNSLSEGLWLVKLVVRVVIS